MSRTNAIFAGLLATAIAAFVPFASATITSKGAVVVVGSSASWAELAVATYNEDGCPTAPVHHGTCQHYTTSANFNLVDTRPTSVGGTDNTDTGGLWIVWDQPTTGTRNVWAFIKVDSIVGDRCFYAAPRCIIQTPSGYNWAAAGNKLSGLWGDGSSDTTPVPGDVTALFGSGVSINTAATDIRPEDALYETCRVNSAIGNGTEGGSDGLDGLGYGTVASGTCPQFGATLAELVGTVVKSGTNGSSTTANPLAFNLSGHDPFTNETIGAGTVLNIGAQPLVFVFSRTSTANSGNGLKGASDATDAELQQIFSGTDCSAGQLAGTAGNDPIDVWLREPLSGTMTTAEMNVFRRPIDTVTHSNVANSLSQETGVFTGGALTNPLKATPCAAGGTRSRGIGTSEEVGTVGTGGVANGGGANNDAIGYTFFSFPNIKPLWNSANYGYLTLDGEDPLGPFTGTGGPWPNQEIPNCTAPCPESTFWSGNSFPGLRSGNYTAWQLLRLVTASATDAKAILNSAYKIAVTTEPDFIPTVATDGDPGVTIWHSHYQQRNGAHAALGSAPTNGAVLGFSSGNPPQTAADKGGEAGGCTIQVSAITATTTDKNYIQSDVVEGPTATCAHTDRN